MANKATPENVAADMSPPNFRAAFKRLMTIKPKKDKISGINGEIADIYAKIEGHKVNKIGARIFMMIHGREEPEQKDILRSLNGLFDAAGMETDSQDLVDKAEDNVVRHRFGTGDDTAASAGDEEDVDALEREVAEDDNAAALKRARDHLGAAGDEDPTRVGDSTDLADHPEAAE
jgi:hypothetical protein